MLIEEAFHLPAATLESIYHYQGVCSDHIKYTTHTEKEERLGTFFSFSVCLTIDSSFC